MIVQYYYLTWSPPRMTQAEALELGRQIAMNGRDNFVREFRKSLAKVEPQQHINPIQKWPVPAQYTLFVAGLALFLFGITSISAYEWIQILVLIVVALVIYAFSSFLAYRRFCKWVDYLIANYAEHGEQAEGKH